mgnify:CR=1 FL=1
MNDPIGDMLTRIRNSQARGKSTVRTPASKLRAWVLDVLQQEGYIRGYEAVTDEKGHPQLDISLKYFDGAPVIQVEGRMFPVEVIHAPLDSLGRDYAEDDENEERHDAAAVASARAEALHYIDGAVESVERIVRESTTGDILVFLPSERDIREAGDLLTGRRLRDCELVPLYGRLSNTEQQRVFAPTTRRKVVLATNIAETSLTIPGIRYVVDTGLARVSRYAPQARTRRLPIEPVAQSSADQRRGRAGRVAEGDVLEFVQPPRL